MCFPSSLSRLSSRRAKYRAVEQSSPCICLKWLIFNVKSQMAAECSAPGGAAFKVWRLSFCLSCVILLTHPHPPNCDTEGFPWENCSRRDVSWVTLAQNWGRQKTQGLHLPFFLRCLDEILSERGHGRIYSCPISALLPPQQKCLIGWTTFGKSTCGSFFIMMCTRKKSTRFLSPSVVSKSSLCLMDREQLNHLHTHQLKL